MSTGRSPGNTTLNDEFARQIAERKVSPQVALESTLDRDDLQKKLKTRSG